MKRIILLLLIISPIWSFAQLGLGIGIGRGSSSTPISNPIQYFDGTIAKSGNLYYLKDKIGTRDALLMDAPCLNIPASSTYYADLGNTVYPTNTNDFLIVANDSVTFEYEFILPITNPNVYQAMYNNGGTANGDKGIRIRMGDDRHITIGISDGVVKQEIRCATVNTAGYNKVSITLGLVGKTCTFVVNGTTTKQNITSNANIPANTAIKLFYYGSGSTYSLISSFIRFKFYRNNVALHEWYFNDGMKTILEYNEHYVIPDLIGTFNLYLRKPTTSTFGGSPFTAVQNSDFYLQEQGYTVYSRVQNPDEIYICPKRRDATVTTQIGVGYSRFVSTQSISSTEFGYHAWKTIDFNPADSVSSFYDYWDTSNSLFWTAAARSDGNYHGGTAGNKWQVDRSWLNKTTLDAYTVKGNIHAKRSFLNFNDVSLTYCTKLTSIRTYSSNYTRPVVDEYLTTRKNNLYFTRPLMAGGTPGYLVAVKDNKYLCLAGNNLYYSSDYGVTYGSPVNISTTTGITLLQKDRYFITPTGTILFVPDGNKKVFRSTDNNINWTESTYQLYYRGTDTIFKHRTNPAYPGTFFRPMDGFYINPASGSNPQIILIGNYGCSVTGAAPAIVWYSIDDGASWKVAYAFGQALQYRDDGTAEGGVTGTLLGDATNPITVRHIYAINMNPYDGTFWVFTGDGGYKNQWMRGTYNYVADTWSWEKMKDSSNDANEDFRIIRATFKDANTMIIPEDAGIFTSGYVMYQVPISTLNQTNTWTGLATPYHNKSIYWLRCWDNGKVLIVFDYDASYTAKIYYSLDWGTTWSSTDNPVYENYRGLTSAGYIPTKLRFDFVFDYPDSKGKMLSPFPDYTGNGLFYLHSGDITP